VTIIYDTFDILRTCVLLFVEQNDISGRRIQTDRSKTIKLRKIGAEEGEEWYSRTARKNRSETRDILTGRRYHGIRALITQPVFNP